MFTTSSVSGGCVRDSPMTTLLTPVEGLILHFLEPSREILVGPRTRRRTRLTSEFRTLVCPMTGFPALVAIAILCWGFGSGCLGLNQCKYLSSRDTSRGSCDIAKGCRWSSDIRCMSHRRPFLSVKLCTVCIFGLATNILEHQFLSDHVSIGARLFFVSNVEERLI